VNLLLLLQLSGLLYTMADPPNLRGDWWGFPLAPTIGDALGLPWALGKDTNVNILAERDFGAGMGSGDLVYLTISTGIGGAAIDHDMLDVKIALLRNYALYRLLDEPPLIIRRSDYRNIRILHQMFTSDAGAFILTSSRSSRLY